MEINLFKDKLLAKELVKKINTYNGNPIKIMEVCGTHTMAISRFAIRKILPPEIKLISGPGCPVCVTPSFYIKAALELSRKPGIIITTFGDMLRIPFKGRNLLSTKAEGADIRSVYSPFEALKIAVENPEKTVVFLSVGFETTIPAVALTIKHAKDADVKNFYVLSANKTIHDALHLISSDPQARVNGYLYPGHVSAIIGDGLYHEIAEKYGIPGAITGFEPTEILASIAYIANACKNDKAEVKNLYSRVVRQEGNMKAVDVIYDVFEPCDAVWRGIGNIPESGLKIRNKFKRFDAWGELTQMRMNGNENKSNSINKIQNDVNAWIEDEPKGCNCGSVLMGLISPPQCALFHKLCTPENPVGACMVSSEGTCAAYYKYER